MPDVTHPAEGIYISKFQAGVASTLIAAAMIGTFSNLWYLNTKAIQFDNLMTERSRDNATLPGALSKAEWEIERRLITAELRAINTKLDELKQQISNEKI